MMDSLSKITLQFYHFETIQWDESPLLLPETKTMVIHFKTTHMLSQWRKFIDFQNVRGTCTRLFVHCVVSEEPWLQFVLEILESLSCCECFVISLLTRCENSPPLMIGDLATLGKTFLTPHQSLTHFAVICQCQDCPWAIPLLSLAQSVPLFRNVTPKYNLCFDEVCLGSDDTTVRNNFSKILINEFLCLRSGQVSFIAREWTKPCMEDDECL